MFPRITHPLVQNGAGMKSGVKCRTEAEWPSSARPAAHAARYSPTSTSSLGAWGAEREGLIMQPGWLAGREDTHEPKGSQAGLEMHAACDAFKAGGSQHW